MSDPLHIVAAGGLFYAADGRVLLVKTPRRGWECPGGQVESGEDVGEAVLREVWEETRCRVRIDRLVGVYTNPVPTAKVIFMFVGTHVEGEPGKGDELDAGWFTVEEALRMVTSEPEQLRLKDALQIKDRPVYRMYRTRPYQLLNESDW